MPTQLIRDDIESMLGRTRQDFERFSGKTILIAGGGGFLGRYLAAYFRRLNEGILRQPCHVISIDNHAIGEPWHFDDHSLEPAHTEEWSDIALQLPEREDIHFIIHAAGFGSALFYKKNPLAVMQASIWGTKNLLDLARRNPGLEGFLYLSSSEIYGDVDPRAIPIMESYRGNVSLPGPRATAAESKRVAEALCVYYQAKHGVPVTIARPFHTYGPGMRFDDRRVIPYFVYQGLNGHPMPVHGDGETMRTFCYITDAIPGLLTVMLKGHPGEAYNVGNPSGHMSITDLAKMCTELIPGASFQYVAYHELYPGDEPRRSAPDIMKLQKLGFDAQVDIQSGLARFVAWAREERTYQARRIAGDAVIAD